MRDRSFSRGILIVPVLAVLISVSASAQEGSRGSVVYAEGREFSIVRGGVSSLYKPDVDDLLSIQIRTGDVIQTAASTFVEVQLVPSGTVLKIAENSSFVFRGLGGSGGSGGSVGDTSLGLIYGRVRAKVAKLGAAESFAIRSGQTVAGVRGTDFGFDSIVKQGNALDGAVLKPELKVYCFEGEVEVTPVAEQKASVSVRADELVSVDLSRTVPVVERRAVDADVVEFWRANEFRGSTPIPAPEGVDLAVQGTPVQRITETEIRYVAPDFRPYRTAIASKNVAVGASLMFAALGAVLQGVGLSYIADDDYDRGAPYIQGGAIALAPAAVSLLYSLFIDVKTADGGMER